MKVSDNYDIREFVSPQTWDKWGEKSIWFVRPVCWLGAELIKKKAVEKYGDCSVVINGWLYNLGYTGSGYREPAQYNTGQFKKNTNSESLHRQGMADDIKIKIKSTGRWLTSVEMSMLVLENEDEFLVIGITTIEDPKDTKGKEIDWLHMDGRTTNKDKILIVKP